MSKKMATILISIIFAALVIAGYWLYQTYSQTPEEKTQSALERTSESAVSGTLPTLGTPENPIQDLETINPASQANPFTQTYQNPFK